MAVRDYLLDAFYSLGFGVNKAGGRYNENEVQEGVVGERLPELELNMSEEDLIELSDAWEKDWNSSEVTARWTQQSEENEKYWKGEHFTRPSADKSRPMVDNVIFEGLETYLPAVTRRNPDPMVKLAAEEDSEDEASQEFVQALQHELGELADELKIRLKLKSAARHKELYLLGVAKFSWDLDRDIPSVKIIRPQRILLDPNAAVDEDGYTGDRIGEKRKLPAWKLIALIRDQKDFDTNKAYIEQLANHKMATELGFIEWWTREYMFWKMGERVLLKRKNPHWNYDQKLPELAPAPELPQAQEPIDPMAAPAPEAAPQPIPGQMEGQMPVPAAPASMPAPAPSLPPQGADMPPMPELPQLGAPQMPEPAPDRPEEPKRGINHFPSPRMPYVLLCTLGLGKQPVDITSNISQNLANQDLINKRNKQIDKNADGMNQGLVVSLERSGLTAQQGSRVTEALRKGGTVVIPAGAPSDAVMRLPTPGLPADVFNQLVDTRTRVRDIWGIRGSSPAGVQNEDTVRGKLIVKGLDTDRIGGGISEYLEQFADDIYNWIAQLLYVYDDRFAGAIANGVKPPKVKISVKEGSLLPKDSTTIANQAIELSGAGKMSTLDLYKRLDYPNPTELAVNAWLEQNAPDVLYADDPRVKQVIEQRAQAQQQAPVPPKESINFKDLPPEGKTQMAKQAGLELDPATIAAHEESQKQQQPSAPAGTVPVAPDINNPSVITQP